MSIYVMSDIHGEADLFHAMLKQIQFSETDTLYILGDVIDRGPDGIALLKEIMDTPNMVMLLGNHEHMMRQCYSTQGCAIDFFRWNRNGNTPTVNAFKVLDASERTEILNYLSLLPSHVRVSVGGNSYYLVHAFPGNTIEEEVWVRPSIHESNPLPETRLVIGHTPVLHLIVPREERDTYIRTMQSRGERPQILFAEGFIDIDCGCSYTEPIKTLGCLRLDDLTAFYEYRKRTERKRIS